MKTGVLGFIKIGYYLFLVLGFILFMWDGIPLESKTIYSLRVVAIVGFVVFSLIYPYLKTKKVSYLVLLSIVLIATYFGLTNPDLMALVLISILLGLVFVKYEQYIK